VTLPPTVLYPESFRSSPSAGNDGDLHWGWQSEAVGRRGIRPADLDACIEINGFFLVTESKDVGKPIRDADEDENVRPRDGQAILRRAFIRTGLVTFLYQWGKRIPVEWQWHTLERKSIKRRATDASIKPGGEMFEFVRRWAEHFDRQDKDAWRFRMIDAALRNSAPSFRQALLEQLRKENYAALGEFIDTPLGQWSVS
jgi:hypothetical protein